MFTNQQKLGIIFLIAVIPCFVYFVYGWNNVVGEWGKVVAVVGCIGAGLLAFGLTFVLWDSQVAKYSSPSPSSERK